MAYLRMMMIMKVLVVEIAGFSHGFLSGRGVQSSSFESRGSMREMTRGKPNRVGGGALACSIEKDPEKRISNRSLIR